MKSRTRNLDPVTGRFNAEYLGDGVYVTTDGFHVWLDLRAQDVQTHNQIALDRVTLANLAEYAQRTLGNA